MKTTERAEIYAAIAQAKRIVVKIGSSSLVYPNGKMNYRAVELLVRQLAELQNYGKQVVLVSSGAVAAGMGKLKMSTKPTETGKRQALAAVGQGLLMQVYEKFFDEYSVNVAQVLLTKDDIAHRERYLNIGNTFNALFEYDIVPIVNENDTTSFAELRTVGDNDTLAALTACLVEADLLILLSDIDGLYTANPRVDENARKLDVIEEITAGVEDMAGSAGSLMGTGGMATKIAAAKIAGGCGIPMVLADGSAPEILYKIFDGEPVGTVFMPRERGMVKKKGWLAYGADSCGRIIVDSGALRALVKKGSSLLPSGVRSVEGHFDRGDIVAICGEENPQVEAAKGFVNYSSAEIERIKGCQSKCIAEILGKDKDDMDDEIIHRDYMSVKV